MKKTEKLVYLNKRIETWKKSLLNPYSFDSVLMNSSTPKKDKIRLWGETLEQIFYLEGRHDEIDSISTIISLELRDMGLNRNVSYARHALPDKYKDESQRRAKRLLSDIYEETYMCGCDDREFTREDYAQENYLEIQQAKKDIELAEKYIEKLHKMHLLSKLDLNEYEQMNITINAARQSLNDAFDERDKVLPSKLHLLMYAYSQGTKSNTFSKYMKYMREIIEITPKQTGKIISGRVNKVDILYDPKDMMEAKHVGFYGKACEECGSFRQDLKYHPDILKSMLYCYACRSWNERTVESLVKKLI